MIVYVPDPLEIYEANRSEKTVTIKLPSGGYITAEHCQEHDKFRIISVCSTNPADYLNNKINPGNFIAMQFSLDN